MIVHHHHALSGLPHAILPIPGAMPQAFTLCRVAAKRCGNTIRADGTKPGSTSTHSWIKFCAAESHPAKTRLLKLNPGAMKLPAVGQLPNGPKGAVHYWFRTPFPGLGHIVLRG